MRNLIATGVVATPRGERVRRVLLGVSWPTLLAHDLVSLRSVLLLPAMLQHDMQARPRDEARGSASGPNDWNRRARRVRLCPASVRRCVDPDPHGVAGSDG